MLRGVAVAGLLALALTGCSAAGPGDPANPGSAAPSAATPSPSRSTSVDPAGRLVGRGTVIGEGRTVRLCASVQESFPPRCGGGVELVGWRWPAGRFERANLITWGDFAVVGTYAGGKLRVVKTLDEATSPAPAEAEPDLTSPCPEPAGGWRTPEPARATYETQDQALQLAERRPGYADAWIDDRGDAEQDPTKIVLNFRFTEDLPGAEQAIRTVWGGALCVTQAQRTRAEADRIQRELQDTPGLLSSSGGVDQVDVLVVVDDGTRQRTLDAKYGAGVVRVRSFLQPYAE